LARLFTSKKDRFRVLIGCAPCTPYSLYTSRYRKGSKQDSQWQLLEEFSRLIIETKPDVVSMENVPRLMRYGVFERFVATLEDEGYAVKYQKVRADYYGVPQRRARLVLIASRWGEVALPPPTHRDRPVTVRDAIGKLPKIQAGKPCPKDR